MYRKWVQYHTPTGQHVRYGSAIAQHLRKLNHRIILTTREHPDTTQIMKIVGEDFKVIGRYDPTSLGARLKASIERELQFYEMLKENPPECAISHGSVELCRTAYGLGIYNICTGDTIHTKANRLIVPLADAMIISEAIPERVYRELGARTIIQFRGVDEVAWIRTSEQRSCCSYDHPLIVVRQSEYRASYMKGRDPTSYVAKKLTKLGNVLYLPRYAKGQVTGLSAPEGFVDSIPLVREADLFIGIGGTIAREAALQGTPSIVIPVLGWSYVNDYLQKMGFPLFRVEAPQVVKEAKRHLGRRVDVRKLLAKLEDPVEVIERIMNAYRAERSAKKDKAHVNSKSLSSPRKLNGRM